MEFKVTNLAEEIDATPDVELEDGKKFREYLMFDLLDGFPRYQEELQNYYVQLIDNTQPKWRGTTAAVSAGERLVFIAIQEAKRLTDKRLSNAVRQQARNNMSLLIRHELLHSILEHQKRTIIWLARQNGWDPAGLTPEQYEKVLALRDHPDFLFRRFNMGSGITAQNGAGDFELSKFYLDRDVELTDAFGGLVLDDHPQWKNYSFEELMYALKMERRDLFHRLWTKAYGKMDKAAMDAGEPGAFDIRKTEDAPLSLAKEIMPEDAAKARLLHVFEYRDLPQNIKAVLWGDDKTGHDAYYKPLAAWLDGPFVKEGYALCGANPSDIKDEGNSKYNLKRADLPEFEDMQDLAIDEIQYRHSVFPVIDVPNLDLYENADENQTFYCFGLPMIVLPHKRGLLYCKAITGSIFDSPAHQKYYSNSTRNSTIQSVLNEWFKKIKTAYQQGGKNNAF